MESNTKKQKRQFVTATKTMSAGNEDQTESEEPPVTVSVDSKCMGRWALGTATYVNYELYKYIQFVNHDEDI